MRSMPDPTLRFLLVWQLVISILVLLLPAAVLGDWPWELPRSELIPFVGLLAAFVSTALLHLLIRHRSGWPRLVSAMVGCAAIFGFLLLALFVTRASSSRVLLLA